ncbi:MAG TPA: hypothetical protein VH619_09360 [Verrucomicrobiae bacterium]|jgi:hypothetical protein|nr:hypothetical protein [Verrucomicrobiae bacterium]
MKRILLLLGLGFIIINVTNGCNKASDNTTTAAPTATDTNAASTNAATTNVPPPAH